MSGAQIRRVRWLTLASAMPMGQQNYEMSIQHAIREVATEEWRFDARSVGGIRSDASVRMPFKLLSLRPLAWASGRLAGRGAEVVHRFDLRIPSPERHHVVTVHDLPPMRFNDEGSMPAWARRSLAGLEVICPSLFAAHEVSELLGATEVTVIPYGVGQAFIRPTPLDPESLAELGVREPFFVHAAGATGRKNLEGLAGAWRMAEQQLREHSLVLLGPPAPRRDELFSGLPRVVTPGRIELGLVARVMAAAEGVLVPSIYEGFGLPALEGMAVGTPVIAVDRGALPEVCGAGAILVEPTPAAIAEALITLGRHQIDRAALVARGIARASAFSWERAARQHLAVYDRVLHGSPQRSSALPRSREHSV